MAAVALEPGEQLLRSRLVVQEELVSIDVPDGLQELTVSLDPERAVGKLTSSRRAAGDLLLDQTLSLEKYIEVILEAKEAGLPVLLGLEVDFFPESIDAVLDFIAPYPWDVLLGSVHWIDGWWFDRPHSEYEWERLGARLHELGGRVRGPRTVEATEEDMRRVAEPAGRRRIRRR